jgi:hypothetical protein
MAARDIVSDWLTTLGRSQGLDLALDGAGMAGLALADGLTLAVEAEDAADAVHIHAELLRLSRETRAAAMEEALALNLFTRRTDGATIGLDRRGDALVLSIMRPVATLDREAFATLLAGFAETAARLRDALRGAALPAAAAPPPRPMSNAAVIDPRLLA